MVTASPLLPSGMHGYICEQEGSGRSICNCCAQCTETAWGIKSCEVPPSNQLRSAVGWVGPYLVVTALHDCSPRCTPLIPLTPWEICHHACYCGVLPLVQLLLAASAPPACVLSASAVVFQDTFSALNPGLSCDNTTSPWCFKYTDTTTAGVKYRGRTMVIDPYNAAVGLEAGALRVLDRLKGLVMTKQVFPTPSGKKLTWTLSVCAAMTNTSHHPLCHAVTKPNDNLRQACMIIIMRL